MGHSRNRLITHPRGAAMRRTPDEPLKACIKHQHGYFRGEKCQYCSEEGELVMSPRHLDQFGRVMAGVLRHFPDRFELEIDQQGWVAAGEFIESLKHQRRHFSYLTMDHLKAVVETDPKGRYQLVDGRLRATYAHSIELELDLPTDDVPEHLYFACSQEDSNEYLEQGLYPLDRQMVHLSGTRLNALEAGRLIIGKPVVLLVDVRAAEKAEKPIMKAGTTVYVTYEVPASCLRKLPDSA